MEVPVVQGLQWEHMRAGEGREQEFGWEMPGAGLGGGGTTAGTRLTSDLGDEKRSSSEVRPTTFLYLKFLVVWALVLLADFVLEFRFEYLWPFWLFIRSVYDSFRYQGLHNGGIPANKKISSTLPELEYREKGKEKDKDAKKHNLGINNNILQPVDSKIQEIEYMENHINSKRLNNDLVGSTENLLKEDSCTASSKNYKNVSGVVNSSPRSHSATNGSIPSSSTKNEKKQKCASKSPSTHKDLMENCIPNNQLSKPDALVRLEQDIKKLKADLQASRQIEQELRSQISSLTNTERGIRSEMGQLRQENELLQNKLHNAVQMKQKDKQMISQLEKKLKAEQEARTFVEKQLMEEKKRKKLEEATAARAVAFAAATRGECTETLRNRIRELETECKKLTIDIKLKEDQIRELEMKVQELRKYKENEKDTEVLMSALSAMQDKTQHLENSLSAETRIKLDLFSALGDAKRQLEIAQGQIIQKDQEIKDLKQKIAEVMAVMPSITYTAATSTLSPVSPHYSSKFVETSPSGLDPNASVYQPLKK
ncbi:macoilin [Pitangus sulphuratus]|nr:macoilin [Pitangus sulphuratus]